MKTYAVTAFALVAGTFAVPSTLDPRQGTSQVTFRLSNDMSGAGAQRTVPADGTVSTLGRLFGGSNLVKNQNQVIATSAQLNTVIPGVSCTFKDGFGVPIALLNERITYTSLSNIVGRAVETNVSGFTFSCARTK